jgi:hypothetical protein
MDLLIAFISVDFVFLGMLEMDFWGLMVCFILNFAIFCDFLIE